MKVNWTRVASLTAAVLVVLACSILIVRDPFPAFEYASPAAELIEIETTSIGPEVGRFLWTYRVVDLIAQAFVLFAAATCCVALVRAE